jgi:hypothetical protein
MEEEIANAKIELQAKHEKKKEEDVANAKINLKEKHEEARKEIITTTKSGLEILSSLRNGTDEYDFDNAKIIKEGGQAIVIEI